MSVDEFTHCWPKAAAPHLLPRFMLIRCGDFLSLFLRSKAALGGIR